MLVVTKLFNIEIDLIVVIDFNTEKCVRCKRKPVVTDLVVSGTLCSFCHSWHAGPAVFI